MRYAIFSDIHDNFPAFRQVLVDADRQNVDHLVCLGDIGRDATLLEAVRTRATCCTYGNWEVSGVLRMAQPVRQWVAQLPATVDSAKLSRETPFRQVVFCHATPEMPASLTTTLEARKYIESGVRWLELFPLLDENELARWEAFAALEAHDHIAAFHGHTHVQQVWAWTTSQNNPEKRTVRSFTEPLRFRLEAGSAGVANRYLIGVGSVGAAEDGPHICYALYDDESGIVELRRLPHH